MPAVPTPAASIRQVGEPDYCRQPAGNTGTPEQQGCTRPDWQPLFDPIDRQQLSFDSVLIVSNGYVIVEAYFLPYSADVKEEVYSVTKTVTGMLTGIAMTHGQLSRLTSLSWISSRNYQHLVGTLGYWPVSIAYIGAAVAVGAPVLPVIWTGAVLVGVLT